MTIFALVSYHMEYNQLFDFQTSELTLQCLIVFHFLVPKKEKIFMNLNLFTYILKICSSLDYVASRILTKFILNLLRNPELLSI